MCVCVCVCIVINRQIVSLYHNSSVWLDTQDASCYDRNPPNFRLDVLSNRSAISTTYICSGIRTHLYQLQFVYILGYRIPECSIRQKSFALRGWQPLIPECSTPGWRAYVLSSTERLFRCIITLQRGQTRKPLQAGIEICLILHKI